MYAHAYYSLYNRDYFVGLIFVVSTYYYLQNRKNWTPQNFHAIPDGRLFIIVVVVAMHMLRLGLAQLCSKVYLLV